MTDYYTLLGVRHTASADEIKKRYRTLSLKYHPDHGGSVEGMARLNNAYDTLSKPLRRSAYDRQLREEIHERAERTERASTSSASYASNAAHGSPAKPSAYASSASAHTYYYETPPRRYRAAQPSHQPRPKRKTSRWARWAYVAGAMAVAVELYFIFGPLPTKSRDTAKTSSSDTSSTSTAQTPTANSGSTSNSGLSSASSQSATDSTDNTQTNSDTDTQANTGANSDGSTSGDTNSTTDTQSQSETPSSGTGNTSQTNTWYSRVRAERLRGQ